MTRRVLGVVLVMSMLVLASCGNDDKKETSGASGGTKLVGLFALAPGACGGDAASGSYFRMVQPNGKAASGPYVQNADSTCASGTITLLQPGTDGGLRTDDYQPQAAPPFDAAGNAVSNRIAQPAKFFAVDFALATNPVDPQTKKSADRPAISFEDSSLRGDLRSLAASWNGQHFNQGSNAARGTFDADTKAYTLEWSSKIVGGPFNNFIGVWHLEGTFSA